MKEKMNKAIVSCLKNCCCKSHILHFVSAFTFLVSGCDSYIQLSNNRLLLFFCYTPINDLAIRLMKNRVLNELIRFEETVIFVITTIIPSAFVKHLSNIQKTKFCLLITIFSLNLESFSKTWAINPISSPLNQT